MTSGLCGQRNVDLKAPLNEELLIYMPYTFIVLSNNIKVLFWIYWREIKSKLK